MKKALLILTIIIAMLAPIGAKAAENRDWWPTQVDDTDLYYKFETKGWWPEDSTSYETIIETITFSPKVISVTPYSRSTKIKADVTTAARLIVVRYTVDGKKWEQKTFRNTSHVGPVTAHRKWQCKLHAKEDYYSSWCARQFKQAGKTLDYKKVAHTRGQMAQVYFDDYLIDRIRTKVKCVKVLNLPVRAKEIRIRYVYTGLHGGNNYSRWLKVR